MMYMGIEQLIQECDILIKGGQYEAAQRKLTAVNTTEVPRAMRMSAAILCRKSGLYIAGLKHLSQIVYTQERTVNPEATAAEIAEYAFLLQGAGVAREALDLLDKVNPSQVPEAFLYRALCHMDLGDFEEAGVHLQFYLGRADISAYDRLRAKYRMAECLTQEGKFADALEFINQILASEEIRQDEKTRRDVIELRVQNYLATDRIDEARTDIGSLISSTNPYRTQKWARLADALQSKSKPAMADLRAEAEAQKCGRSVREIDYFTLKIGFDQDLFDQLIFGTPSRTLRKRLEREFAGKVTKERHVHGPTGTPSMDAVTGDITGLASECPPRLVHRLINTLTRDFYQPISTGALFADLFPGEQFDVFTSIHRVHQAIHRARRWFESQQIPMIIVEYRGHYSMAYSGPFSLRVPLDRITLDAETRRFQALAGHFGEQGFTAREARMALGLTPAIFKALMIWAEESGHVSRMGAGPSTRYRIVAV